MRKTIAAILLLVLGGAAQAADHAKPVVELFTSQGCSSCPPADAFLAELAKKGEVVALSQHVDYWNYIGWADPFSDAGGTERQQIYRKALNTRYVYTPQMVFDGAAETSGADRAAVEKRLAASKSRARIAIEVDGAKVRIPANQLIAKGATVWRFDIDKRHETRIERGENKGVTLVNANVVRKIERVATYQGEPLEIAIDLAKLREAGRGGAAIVVQNVVGGRIFGGVIVDADRPGS
jgi:hypothetical protein